MAFDSIRDLRLFVRIYEQSSITAASALLDMTPAVASKRLKNLESDVGEALFHRSTRSLSPTGAGTVLYEYARAVIATVDEADACLDAGSEPSGLLKITTSVAFGRLYLADIVARFLERYSKVRIDVQFTDRIVDLVDEGIDLAFRISAPDDAENQIMRRLCSGRRILCASADYLREHGTPANPEMLARHNCVVLNHYDVWKLESAGHRTTIKVGGNYHTNDGEAILDVIRNGLGIGVVALWQGAPDIAAGRLARVLPEHELLGQPDVYAIYHPTQRRLPRLRCFLEFLEEQIRYPFEDADELLSRHTG